MKRFSKSKQIFALPLAGLFLLQSCASSTMIVSSPAGARVYLNEQAVGTTPYLMRDTKIVGSCTSVRLEKAGYDNINTNICRNEKADAGPIIAGIVLGALPLFLWCMKYDENHSYILQPEEIEVEKSSDTNAPKSLSEQLRDLKSLLDDGIITQEEFDVQKAKILGN